MNDAPPNVGPSVFDSSRLRPGMVAAISGLYRVHHYQHRAPHMVFISAGTVFPACRRCGNVVQFAPLIAATAVEGDDDFYEKTETAAG